MKIYSLQTIQKMYEADRLLYEAQVTLQKAGYTIVAEDINIENSGLKQVDENPKVVSFLEKVLNNLDHFGHLVADKIDNYLLGRLLDVAKSFSIEKVINYLKSNKCYM